MKTIIIFLLGISILIIACKNPMMPEEKTVDQKMKLSGVKTFGVIINEGANSTDTSIVNLKFCAPSATILMIISNDSTFSKSHWETYSETKEWELSPGNGEKTIYVKFRNYDAAVTKVYHDSIIKE